MFTTRADIAESRSLGLPGAAVLAVSSTGELAVSLDRHIITGVRDHRDPRPRPAGRRRASRDPRERPGRRLVPRRTVPRRLSRRWATGAASSTRSERCCTTLRAGSATSEFRPTESSSPSSNTCSAAITTAISRSSTRSGKLRLAGPFMPGFSGLAWSSERRRGLVGRNPGDVDRRPRPARSGLRRTPTSRTSPATEASSSGTGRRVGRWSDFPRAERRPRNLTELNWSFPVRHLLRRQPRSVHRAAAGAARRLRPGARRVACRADWRGGRVCILARRPVGADVEDAGAPPGRARADRRRRAPDARYREPDLRMGELVSGRKADPPFGQRARTRRRASTSVDVAGGQPRAISPEGVAISAQIISPDGRSIVGARPGRPIRRLPRRARRAPPHLGSRTGTKSPCAGRPTGALCTSRASPSRRESSTSSRSTTGKRSRFTQFDPPDPTGIEMVGPR